MSSYGDHFSADTIVCRKAFIKEAHETEQHRSRALDIQNPKDTGATSKIINAVAGTLADKTDTKLGFWGATPADQPDTVADLVVDAAAVSATPTANTTSANSVFGFLDSATMAAYTTAINANKDKANANAVKVNKIIAHLKALGLIKAA